MHSDNGHVSLFCVVILKSLVAITIHGYNCIQLYLHSNQYPKKGLSVTKHAYWNCLKKNKLKDLVYLGMLLPTGIALLLRRVNLHAVTCLGRPNLVWSKACVYLLIQWFCVGAGWERYIQWQLLEDNGAGREGVQNCQVLDVAVGAWTQSLYMHRYDYT